MKNTNLYMVIDITSVKTTRIMHVNTNEKVTQFGRDFNSDYPDIKIIAPPIAGRSFSKFEILQLQYLFWNTFHAVPEEDYGKLVNNCLEKALNLKIND